MKQPLRAHYEELFGTHTDVTQVISAGYSDILQTHKLVLRVFAQRSEYAHFLAENLWTNHAKVGAKSTRRPGPGTSLKFLSRSPAWPLVMI